VIEEIENKTYRDSETGILVDFAAEKGVYVQEKSGQKFIYGVETAVSPAGDVGYLIQIPSTFPAHKSVIEAIANEIGFYVSVIEP
jgi:hypothetical protein